MEQIINESWLNLNTGRKGPVWIDIPADIQAKEINKYKRNKLLGFTKSKGINLNNLKVKIKKYNRPLILAGYGIRQSKNVKNFKNFIEKYEIPYVSTYGARDYTYFDHELNIGTVGNRGSRAGNFALQNADILLILGSSLGSSVVGYAPELFSPKSYKILVDCDNAELSKEIIKIDEKINTDLDTFFENMK